MINSEQAGRLRAERAAMLDAAQVDPFAPAHALLLARERARAARQLGQHVAAQSLPWATIQQLCILRDDVRSNPLHGFPQPAEILSALGFTVAARSVEGLATRDELAQFLEGVAEVAHVIESSAP